MRIECIYKSNLTRWTMRTKRHTRHWKQLSRLTKQFSRTPNAIVQRFLLKAHEESLPNNLKLFRLVEMEPFSWNCPLNALQKQCKRLLCWEKASTNANTRGSKHYSRQSTERDMNSLVMKTVIHLFWLLATHPDHRECPSLRTFGKLGNNTVTLLERLCLHLTAKG